MWIEWNSCGSTWAGGRWRSQSSCMITTRNLNAVRHWTSTTTTLIPFSIMLLLSSKPPSPTTLLPSLPSHTSPSIHILHTSDLSFYVCLSVSLCVCVCLITYVCVTSDSGPILYLFLLLPHLFTWQMSHIFVCRWYSILIQLHEVFMKPIWSICWSHHIFNISIWNPEKKRKYQPSDHAPPHYDNERFFSKLKKNLKLKMWLNFLLIICSLHAIKRFCMPLNFKTTS